MVGVVGVVLMFAVYSVAVVSYFQPKALAVVISCPTRLELSRYCDVLLSQARSNVE